MKRYRVENPVRFQMFKDVVGVVAWILLLLSFLRFLDIYDSMSTKEEVVTERHVYEMVYETSEEDSRVKEPELQEVVYRCVER